MSTWFVYILRCADGSLYTGVTTDLQRREREHNECNRKGARYTRARRPVQLVWSETHPDRATALQRECVLKRLRKPQKERLVAERSWSGNHIENVSV